MNLTELLQAVANAIRTKKGTTGTINAQNFPTEILSIPKGSGNAQPSDVLNGKTFTNNSGEQTGTIPVRQNGTNTVGSGKDGSGILFYIPYGYYPEYSNGKAWIASDPSQYGNANASDVLSGKTFTSSDGLKVSGGMTNRGAWGTTVNAGGSVIIPAGYHNGSGIVNANSDNSQLFFNHSWLSKGMVTSDVDVGSAKKAKKIYIHLDASTGYGKRDFGIKGSNDKSSWVDIINYPPNYGNVINSIENTNAYRYYRVWCDGNTAGYVTAVGIAVMV